MATFKTSAGRTIEEVSGYREAHPRYTAADVFPPDDGFQGLTPFGIDGFIKDLYEYALMIDLMESLGIPTHWKRALDVGGSEGTISRFLRGEARADWAATLDLVDFSRRLSTAAFTRHWMKFRVATALCRFSPSLRRFLIGEGAWRGRRLTPVYAYFGYAPPVGSVFWRPQLRALPRLDAFLATDFYTLTGQFDLITSFLAMPHFDVARKLAKVSELLPEGGTFFVLTDSWWFPVSSALLVGRFPYAAQRMTEQDFRRYVDEFHPGERDDWMRRYAYFHEGKQRPTLNEYVEIADRVGLEVRGWRHLSPPHLTHNRAVLPPRLLDRCEETRLDRVLSDVRAFRPDVGLIDLLSNYLMAVFVKRPTRTRRLAEASRSAALPRRPA